MLKSIHFISRICVVGTGKHRLFHARISKKQKTAPTSYPGGARGATSTDTVAPSLSRRHLSHSHESAICARVSNPHLESLITLCSKTVHFISPICLVGTGKHRLFHTRILQKAKDRPDFISRRCERCNNRWRLLLFLVVNIVSIIFRIRCNWPTTSEVHRPVCDHSHASRGESRAVRVCGTIVGPSHVGRQAFGCAVFGDVFQGVPSPASPGTMFVLLFLLDSHQRVPFIDSALHGVAYILVSTHTFVEHN